MAPRTNYARCGDVAIAYQVTGKGPLDLVWAPGTMSHLDLDWEMPLRAIFLDKLGQFCRVIKFDKRGTGLSDRPTRMATLEERTDDIRAVMDSEKVDRASLFGISEGGSMACLFTALNPDRVRSLMVWGAQARWSSAPGYPWGLASDEYEELFRLIREDWASEHYIRGPGAGLGPDADQALVEAFARYMQAAASPTAVEAYERMNRDIDIRAILPVISVPTLVMNRTGDPVAHIEAARDLAARIQNAQFKEYPGNTHPVFTKDMDAVLADIQMFLTGERPAERADRRLAAILLVDVVSSTEHLARDGDAAWRNTLAAYYKLVRKEIDRFLGEEFTVAGDGFLASFDGPARAVMCALAISSTVKQLGIEVRAGVHVGEVAIVDDNLTGIAVHCGSYRSKGHEPGRCRDRMGVANREGFGVRFGASVLGSGAAHAQGCSRRTPAFHGGTGVGHGSR